MSVLRVRSGSSVQVGNGDKPGGTDRPGAGERADSQLPALGRDGLAAPPRSLSALATLISGGPSASGSGEVSLGGVTIMMIPIYQVGTWCWDPGSRDYIPISQMKERGPRQVQGRGQGLPASGHAGALAQVFIWTQPHSSYHVPVSHDLREPCNPRAATEGSERPITGGIQATAATADTGPASYVPGQM